MSTIPPPPLLQSSALQDPAPDIKVPIITKQEFCKVLNFLRDSDARFQALSDAASAVSPGFTVDFYPNVEYESIIIGMLDKEFRFTSPSESLIDYFVYELDYGRAPTAATAYMIGDEKIDLTTPENLYDFLIRTFDK